MRVNQSLKYAVASTLAAAALSAQAQQPSTEVTFLEEIIVTAQKREENVQSVPIAVTAITADSMQLQRVDFGADLQRAVPNLYFSRAGVGETNFQIRGIGYQLVSTAGDQGVGLHTNNVPLSVSRIADAEFYDLERIEVLRGPQGTLYGRNATGGVINVITAKPSFGGVFGSGSVEYGSYETKKASGHLNVPLGDVFALRVAGTWLDRDGYTFNTVTGKNIDGRGLWSARATLLFQPTENFKATLRAERFDEDDDRTGGAREFCIKDPGPTTVGGVPTGPTQNFLSRGCLSGSIYSSAANGTVNYVAALAGQLGNLAGFINGDIYAGVVQSPDWRTVSIAPLPNHVVPQYHVLNDLYELNLEWKLTEALKLTSLTAYVEDELLTVGAGASYSSNVTFNNVAGLAPGGVYNDPQIGPASSPRVLTIQHNVSDQVSTELRLQSDFDGALNFNIGGIYLNVEKVNDLFIVPNTQNAFVELANITNNNPLTNPFTSCAAGDCYLDTSRFPDGTGHNYFVSHVPYELTASALFGELYWDVVDTFRITTGVRYTDDKKEILLHPSNMLQPGRGATPNAPIPQEASWQEVTGRVNFDWHPTDNVLLYASYSKGYKGGGINNPNANESSPAYKPEFVNAYEIGSKNTLAGGHVVLNATAFMYDYEDYQISQLRGLVSATENIDAEVRGAELEFLWEPIDDLRFNVVAGWLDTEILSGSSIDTFDRIQGQSGVSIVKATNDTCLASTAQLAQLIAAINANPADTLTPSALLAVCAGRFSSANPANPLAGMGIFVNPLPSNPVNLAGKELPQSPEFTVSTGVQYTFGVGGGWKMTVRGDYYRQSDSFMRIYNSVNDELKAWDNASASIVVGSDAVGLYFQAYGKNLMDDDVITGYSHNSDQLGLTRTATLLDPRLYGLNITYKFGN